MWSKKVGYVTGGARGLGYEFVSRLLGEFGMRHVTLVDMDESACREAERSLTAKFGGGRVGWEKVDVTETGTLERSMRGVADREGRLDVVVNNAGIATGMMEHMELATAINLMAVMQGTRIAGEIANEVADRGVDGFDGVVVVNIASAAGMGPVPFAPVYAATKAGVVNFSKSCVPAFFGGNLRVTVLCPTFARTRMVADTLKDDPGFVDEAVKGWGGLLEVEDVGNAFSFILNNVDDVLGKAVLVSPKGIKAYGDRKETRKAASGPKPKL